MDNGTGAALSAGKDQQKTPLSFEVSDFLISVAKITLVLVLLLTSVLRYATVIGDSMNPTFINGDRIIAVHGFYTPERGDVVAVYDYRSHNRPLIKRVIAVAGDTVRIDGILGEVYVNGVLLNEPYVNSPTNVTGDVEYPVTVPENCVFVIGDNRNDSHDSRFQAVGMIHLNSVIGEVVLRFFPFDSIEVFA